MFILFEYDNCSQRGIGIGLRNNLHIIHFDETMVLYCKSSPLTDRTAELALNHKSFQTTQQIPATFGPSAKASHRMFSYTSDTMSLLQRRGYQYQWYYNKRKSPPPPQKKLVPNTANNFSCRDYKQLII